MVLLGIHSLCLLRVEGSSGFSGVAVGVVGAGVGVWTEVWVGVEAGVGVWFGVWVGVGAGVGV